ncbi:hypothetical protein ES703_61584 [subsurface metagenome]
MKYRLIKGIAPDLISLGFQIISFAFLANLLCNNVLLPGKIIARVVLNGLPLITAEADRSSLAGAGNQGRSHKGNHNNDQNHDTEDIQNRMTGLFFLNFRLRPGAFFPA